MQALVQSGGMPYHWVDHDQDQNWLRTSVGYDPFDDVTVLRVGTSQVVNEILRNKEQFSDLEQISFCKGVTDESLLQASEFNDFAQLQVGEFVMAPITDDGLKHLRGWTNARILFFNACAFTDDGLAHLAHFPKLERLSLFGDEGGSMVITDAGMLHVAKISTLKSLTLCGMPINDEALESLASLSNLERLALHRTEVTEKGVKDFRKALPDCWVFGLKDSLPTVDQISQIRVTDASAAVNEVAVISSKAKIANVKARLEPLFHEKGISWKTTPEGEWDLKNAYTLQFESSKRVFCHCVIGDGFILNAWDRYRPITAEQSTGIRQALGVKALGIKEKSD